MNKRDRVFCEEYLIDLSPKNAALRAGFKPNTAAEAWKWIRDEEPTKPAVKAEIDRLMAERSKRTGITAERVLREVARIAFADISDVVDPETGKLLKTAAKDDLAAVAAVKVKKGRRAEGEVRLHDKVHALEMLSKHLDMQNSKGQIDRQAGDLPEILKAVAGIE